MQADAAGPARRVVTGSSPDRRSVIVVDGPAPEPAVRPTGMVVTPLWLEPCVPVALGADTRTPVVTPAVAVRIVVFPPDEEVDPGAAAAYEASLRDLYGEQGDEYPARVPGMHRTQTLDVVTVIDGEIWLVLDEGETLLRSGDSVVQRGTRHAWQNRSSRPCTVVSTALAATTAG